MEPPFVHQGHARAAQEHVRSSVITSDAYSVVPSVVLTGEEASPLAYIVPRRPLDLHGGFGTVLLVLGLGRMRCATARS